MAEKKYSESHEWIEQDADVYKIGITEHAAKELGDIVYVEMPSVGDSVTIDTSFGVVESVKSVSDLISPLSGEVIEINEALEAQPEIINQDAENNGWIMKLKLSDEAELNQLLDKAGYDKFVEEEK